MDAIEESGGQLQVIFDGRCGLCNGLVRWLLRRDRNHRLRFVPADSAPGAALLVRLGRDSGEASHTILVILEDEKPAEGVLIRTEAVAAVLRELPPPWPYVARVLCWIPRPARDLAYRLVARWRYCIRGRLEHCPLPSEAERERFS